MSCRDRTVRDGVADHMNHIVDPSTRQVVPAEVGSIAASR
jgi:hypothetical protein